MKAAELKRIHREEANVRQVIRNKRTDQDQIVELDKMFGKGQGAKKERKRLLSRIAKANEQDNPEDGEKAKDTRNAADKVRKDNAAKHNKEIAEK